MPEFIALANRLADEAGEIVKKYYRQPFDIESKADDTPVTIADRAIEQRLREIIEAERPDDGILGEEFGPKHSQNGYTWVIDPIDGTKSFIVGRPTFGTLIALCKNDVPILGIIDQAVLGERWLGAEGQQTSFNGAPIKTRRCKDLNSASICSTTPIMFADHPEFYERFAPKMIWGADCYLYGALAMGCADVVIETLLSPYDFAALVPIIKGAGGYISDWDGKDLTLKSDGKVIALGDAALWPDLKAFVQS